MNDDFQRGPCVTPKCLDVIYTKEERRSNESLASYLKVSVPKLISEKSHTKYTYCMYKTVCAVSN
jgi:hypothetical protein